MSRRTLGACAGVIAALGAWTLTPDDHAAARASDSSAAHARAEALRHARVRLGDINRAALTMAPPDRSGELNANPVTCHFVLKVPGGTTPKFDCGLPSGEVVRVKYGHTPEIHAEVAATRLLTALGYATDRMYVVPRLRCYGCPPHPFISMRALGLVGAEGVLDEDEGDYTDYEWVAVERKFDAPAIEDDEHDGWAWWELKHVERRRTDVDALRLLAVFLAHWDNKEDNQRLVCMDAAYRPGSRCRDSLLMIQDLGSTFGPAKVNLSQWRELPVWSDRATCRVSMRALPYRGATFGDAQITEGARVRVGEALSSFSDAELRAWFSAARFPQFYTATDDEKDLDAWVEAYRRRVSQILGAGPCPRG